MVKISIIAGVLIVALSLAYYLVIYIPQRDQAIEEQQKQAQQMQIQEKETAIDNLNRCLEENRENQLNTNLGFVDMQKAGKINDADLNNMIDENNKRADKAENNCFRMYPQN